VAAQCEHLQLLEKDLHLAKPAREHWAAQLENSRFSVQEFAAGGTVPAHFGDEL
jgi:hypothetical protein